MHGPSAAIALALLTVTSASSAGDTVGEHFQDQPVGLFPYDWQDVGAVDPKSTAPDPSVTVEATTGPGGDATHALALSDAIALTSGIYRSISISDYYTVGADVRIDRYCDASGAPATDWPMFVCVGQQIDNDYYAMPAVGLYASSLTQTWNVFGSGTAGTFEGFDTGVPAEVGTWYRVEVELEAATGHLLGRVRNLETDELVLDLDHVLLDWTPEDSQFDAVAFFDGEGTAKTTSNLAMVDNICAMNERFETSTLGAIPDGWLDVGAVDPESPAPDPSAIVISTNDANGATTQAIAWADGSAPSQGVYRPIPISDHYSVSADVRIDQFSDADMFLASDWTIQVGVAQAGEQDFFSQPAVGLFVSTQSETWAVFGWGTAGASDTFDLGIPAEIGVWYRVEVSLESATGHLRARARNIATDEIVVDVDHLLLDWTPEDSLYDVVTLYEGDPNSIAQNNITTVDNVCSMPGMVDEPGGSPDLNGDGAVNVLDLLILLGEWGVCDGACVADINGDGSVNVLDLLILLTAWG